MKFKVKNNKKTGIKRFFVESDKDDQLGYAEAEALKRGRLVSLLPLTYTHRGRIYSFSYAAQGLFPLSQAVTKPFAPRQLERMLISFLDLMLECENNGLMRQRVSASPDYILFNPGDARLYFVYVPLQSFAPTDNDLRNAVIYLCEYAQVPPQEYALRESVLDHMRRTTVFTSVDFGAYLTALGLVQQQQPQPIDLEPLWVDTETLGARAMHGRDFVTEQMFSAQAAYDAQAAYADAPSAPTPAARGWFLTRVSNGCCWQLVDGAYDIGRMDDCSICLSDVNGLSRRHAELYVAGDHCEIRDLGSTNGVSVNGRRLGPGVPTVLARGDYLQLGSELFEIR